MKVVHFCNVALPPDHPDAKGIQFHPGRWVLNLAIAQRRYAGVDAQLLMHVPGASRDFDTEIEGVPARFLAVPDQYRSATLFYFDRKRLARAARQLAPDFIHAHGTEDAYSLAAQTTGLPYVITAQGLFFLINSHLPPKTISRERIVEFMERRTLLRAHDVIAKSDYVGSELKRQFPRLRIHRIPNTIDERLMEIREAKAGKIIAFVGVITPRKGLDNLCDALMTLRERVPDLQLWVFGDRGASVADPYEQGIRARLESVLGDRVVFHGTIPGIEVARRVAQAKALVAPSLEEMFGNQLVEALTVGTHGIVTEDTAMAENVRRYGNGTVVPQHDPVALAAAIEQAVCAETSPVEAEQARERVWQDLGPESVARRHLELYQQIVQEFGAGAGGFSPSK